MTRDLKRGLFVSRALATALSQDWTKVTQEPNKLPTLDKIVIGMMRQQEQKDGCPPAAQAQLRDVSDQKDERQTCSCRGAGRPRPVWNCSAAFVLNSASRAFFLCQHLSGLSLP